MMRIGIYVIALIAIVSIGASTPLVVSTAYAQNPREGLDNAFKWAEIKTTKANLPVVAGNILRIFLGLVGLGSMLAFVYGGAIWMQARGNQEDVKKGKDILKYAVLGIAIAATAYAVVNFTAKRLEENVIGSGAPDVVSGCCYPVLGATSCSFSLKSFCKAPGNIFIDKPCQCNGFDAP